MSNPTSPNWSNKALATISGLMMTKELIIIEAIMNEQEEDENLNDKKYKWTKSQWLGQPSSSPAKSELPVEV